MDQWQHRARRALPAALLAAVVSAAATAGNNPVDEKWWPGEFGADDQAGATNYITPSKRLSGAQLVKKGEVATLGMPYHLRTPVFPGRLYSITIPGGGTPTHNLDWSGEGYRQTFMDELVTAHKEVEAVIFDKAREMKRRNGYSDEKILRKRDALENVLVLYRAGEDVALLRAAGFSQLEEFFRWYNVCGVVAVE